MIKRLSHISLSTPDLPRAIAFYQKVLSCTVAHEFKNTESETYGVFLHAGDGTFIEFFNTDEPIAEGGSYRHFCFEAEDLDLLAEHFAQHDIHTEITRSRSDKTLQCWINDPDGNTIEFHQYDPKSALYKLTAKKEMQSC